MPDINFLNFLPGLLVECVKKAAFFNIFFKDHPGRGSVGPPPPVTEKYLGCSRYYFFALSADIPVAFPWTMPALLANFPQDQVPAMLGRDQALFFGHSTARGYPFEAVYLLKSLDRYQLMGALYFCKINMECMHRSYLPAYFH